ncbi:uncharacterized protein LOC111336160 [Stylophora pistillata]|uniref:uncharacterized protein LOC111336160 n=1 Tax=Stylophora pistillata TaxID=50429 RepID=UPI000C0489DB|nr:uncharacterized protein LOC111336160 [Stylophora pistillata]
MAEKSEKNRTTMPRLNLKIPSFRRNSSPTCPNPSVHEERSEGDIFFSPESLLKIKEDIAMDKNGFTEIVPSPKVQKKKADHKHKDSTNFSELQLKTTMASPKAEKKIKHERQKSKDQLELDPENLMTPRQEPKRSPFFLPKFGSSGKTQDSESPSDKLQDTPKSEKKKLQKQQKTPDCTRTPTVRCIFIYVRSPLFTFNTQSCDVKETSIDTLTGNSQTVRRADRQTEKKMQTRSYP